ncbi:MAG TPA: ATP-binding protein [Thermodesulfobacteriota bacterium]|nr:ATP-binding protein [Thermodesulfobacteriota bacterium]
MNVPLVTRLLAAARSGVLVVDADGRVVFVNDAAARLLGLTAPAAAGRPVSELLAAHPPLLRLVAGAAAGEATPPKTELAIRTAGRERTIGCTAHAGRDEQGRPLGALVLFKELSRVETGLEATLARERLAAVGAMAAAVAHEMRNPLAGIRLSATLLKRRLPPALDEAGLLDEIIAEVRRLEETVSRCLTYLRPLSLAFEEVDLNQVVREALGLCAASAAVPLVEPATAEAGGAAGAVRVELRLAEGLPRITADPDRLREAVANLITNALQAMEGKGGTLTLATAVLAPAGEPAGEGSARRSAGAEEPAVAVTVRDTGPGIDPDILDRIFYPFFTTKADGSGVGLATVQKIAAGHGGWVDVASEPGRGATFRLVLPLAPAGRKGGVSGWRAA